MEIFYDNLEEIVADTPKKDIPIITGDWNAKASDNNTWWRSVMGKYGCGKRNERGNNCWNLQHLTIYLFVTQHFNKNQTANEHGNHQTVYTET